jgi:hypothetical protein
MLNVTAKPSAGTAPKYRGKTPATRVVMWLSRTVPKARRYPAPSAQTIERPARTSSRMRS